MASAAPKPRTIEELPYYSYLVAEENPPTEDAEYDTALFENAEFDDVRVSNLRCIESAFVSVNFGNARLRMGRFNDVWLDGCQCNGTDLAETSWLDAEFIAGSLAGTALFDAEMRRVTFFGCKLLATNFRGSTLRDIAFVNCTLRDVDFGGANLTNVSFPGSAISGLCVDQVTSSGVDFRAASELDIYSGFDSLKGMKISNAQLFDLAPAFALSLGVVVGD